MTATTATTAEIAAALNTTPRELRKFLRADAKSRNATDSLPGKGSRYSLPATKTAITALNKKFIAWSASQDAKRESAKTVTEVDEVNDLDSDIGTDAEVYALTHDMGDEDLDQD